MKKKSAKKAPAKPATTEKSNDNSKICAILAYLLVGIIWYFVDAKMKKDAFVKFHVKQGLVLLIVGIVLSIALNLLWFIGWILMPLVQLVMLVLAILGIINAANGKKAEVPLIGQFAKKLTF